MTLEDFIYRIENFTALKPAEQIPYFAYYITEYKGLTSFSSTNISECFNELRIPQYSNISAFLSKEKNAKRLLKHKDGGYTLSRNISENISSKIGQVKVKTPSSDLFPIELLRNTRTYIVIIGQQAILCYDYQLYDACLVMIRKLLETLIIELFERYKVPDRIKNDNGNYFFCSELIDKLLLEDKLWTIGRNTRSALPKIKEKGDLSAHNRRFNAKKSDVDSIKDSLRVVIEELVLCVNYEQWNKEMK